MSSSETPRVKLVKQLKTMLGDNMVEIELDPIHYNTAIDLAIDRLYQRTDGSLHEEMMFLTLEVDKNEYTLPANVQEVKKIYRRGVGVTGSSGVNFDPFSSVLNNYFLLQHGQTGGIATWELFSQYRETLGRIFGSEIDFIWNRNSNVISIMRKAAGVETVMIAVFVRKHEDALITDAYSRPWLRDYALAQCKMMLGDARDKYPGGFPGPNGMVTLNGAALKGEANAEFQRLEVELQNFVTSDMGIPFIIA